MQDIELDEPRREVQPMFGSGFVSHGWTSGMLEEGPGMIAVGVLMGAFCGLVLGLITLQLARFLSLVTGRNLGGTGWTLICMALGAIAFGVMSASDRE